MKIIGLVVGISTVAIVAATASPPSKVLGFVALRGAIGTIGMSPENLQSYLGPPAFVERAGKSAFGISNGRPVTSVEYYNVIGGGRVAFMFTDHERVVAVGFDTLGSAQRVLIVNFFFVHGPPRKTLLKTCNSSYFRIPGTSAGGPNRTAASIAALWSTPSGGLLFTRYRLNGRERAERNAGRGNYPSLAIADDYRLHLLQLIWMPYAGQNRITNIHPGRDAVLSTENAFKNSQCN